MTRFKFNFFFLLSLLAIPTRAISMDFDFMSELDDLFNDQDFIENGEFIGEETLFTSSATLAEITVHKNSCLDSCEALEILTDPSNNIDAQILLQENLYLRTHPANSRSLLDLPGFYRHYCFPRKNYFWSQLFYNQTTRQYYTKESTQLKTYIALDNPNLIQKIDDFEPNFDVPTVLGIFSNMRFEERRLGLMGGGQYVWDKWHLRSYAPIVYTEYNFNLTAEEQLMLERAGLEPQDDPVVFAKQHLIIDKVGLGDTRFEIEYMPVESDCMFFRLGGLFTLPTGVAFAQGLYGTHFDKDMPKPDFSLLEFLNLAFNTPKQDPQAAEAQAEEFLLAAVDRLSTLLLETGMGNNGHVGLGVVADHQICLSDRATLRTKASLEYLIPKTEKRFYIRKKTPAEFLDRDYTSTDPEVCDENLAFLNEQLIQTLFPCMFETRIFPGYIFIWNTGVTYHGKKFDFEMGADLWWQDKEKLGRIKAPESVVETLRTDIAIKPGAFQAKLFGDLVYRKQGTKRNWRFGFHLDATFISVGIGKDFTGALYFDATI